MARNEEAWVLTGRRRGGVWLVRRWRRSVGKPAEVSADDGWAFAREEAHGDLAGFLHTHPDGTDRPSSRDVRTMRAWCDMSGRPMLCLIRLGPRRADRVVGFRFDDHACGGVPIARVEVFDRGMIVCVEAPDCLSNADLAPEGD